MSLDEADPEQQLSDLIGAYYDAALDPDGWPRALELTTRYVHSKTASVFWQDPATRSALIVHSFGEDPAYAAAYIDTYVRLNPFLPAMSFIELGQPFSSNDLIPQEQFAETRFFKEWVAPQGHMDAIAVNLHRFSTSTAAITMQRGRDHGVVDDEMRRRVALLVPHVQRAVAIGREVDRTRARSETLEAVLRGVSASVFLVDSGCRIGFANDAGRALMEAGDVIADRDGALRAVDRTADRQLRETVAAAGGAGDLALGDRPAAIALSSGADGRYLAHVLPLGSGLRPRAALRDPAVAAVFVRRAEIPTVSGVEALSKLHRLTPAEIRVLHAAATKGAVGEMATALGMSLATVKTHLASLFTKLGARRRADLVRAVAAHGSPLT